MKILTLMGTRPEIIRLSVIIKKLDELLTHILVYTNQNFTDSLSTIFFKDLKIREPDYTLCGTCVSFGEFLGAAMFSFERVLLKENPDKILILGDTNSGLLALVANRYKIPIIHMEAGSRCFSAKVPEEINRKIIDMLSTHNLPYTENSKQNLLAEGFSKNHVFKTGNPIYEVLNFYKEKIDNSNILEKFDLESKNFVLVTAHRTENVDNVESLADIVKFMNKISEQFKVVTSLHPRTKDNMLKHNLSFKENIIVSESLGFFDFNKLSKRAKILVSDSGSNPEISCLFNVPSLIIRESTERKELIECGASILTGVGYDNMIESFDFIQKRDYKWVPPEDYLVPNVSDIVINILLGK